MLFELGALSVIGQVIYTKLENLDTIVNKRDNSAGQEDPSEELVYKSELTRTELELRQALSILFEFIIYNNQTTDEHEFEQLKQELTQPSIIPLEEICMKAIKFSLDL